MEPSFDSAPHPRIAIVLGKPVRPNTLMSNVVDLLRTAPATIAIHLPAASPPPPWLAAADLIVHRGLDLTHLAALLPLETAGIPCCNRIATTIAVGDRTQMIRELHDAGLPVPATTLLTTWPEVLARATGQPIVVKAADGSIGRGQGVTVAPSGDLPAVAPFSGPYTLQEYIPNDGHTYKVYVAGPAATGVAKLWPPPPIPHPGTPFPVDPAVADLVHRAGAALGLEIYGIDLLFGPNGPVIVDANPFPAFRGVANPAPLVARHLLTLAHHSIDL